jgi:plastocyanin
MDGNFFFVMGIVLVLAAVGLAAIGIRGSGSFPGSRPAMVGVVALFAAIVAGTMAFAVVKSRDEQDKRREELAKQETTAQAEAGAPAPPAAPPTPGGQPQAAGGGNQQPPAPAGATTSLDVSSPPDGSLVFDPNGLEAKPGTVTITYDNPSPVPHSIAVATSNGNVLGQTDPFSAGKQEVTLDNLAPGKYVFYCTVPGHREAGMQGDLTVQ